ncbi:MAG: hypothetical protein MdMp014T_2251 [Treponematales bacterium]
MVVAYSDKYTYEAAGTNHTSGAGIGNGNYAFDNNCNMSITIDITGGTVIAGSASVGGHNSEHEVFYPVDGIGIARGGSPHVSIGGTAVVLATSICSNAVINGSGVLAIVETPLSDKYDHLKGDARFSAAETEADAIQTKMALIGSDAAAGTFTLTAPFTVPANATLTVPPGWTLDCANHALNGSRTGSVINSGN